MGQGSRGLGGWVWARREQVVRQHHEARSGQGRGAHFEAKVSVHELNIQCHEALGQLQPAQLQEALPSLNLESTCHLVHLALGPSFTCPAV